MSKRYGIQLAGEGGQGVVLAAVILAEAAAIHEGKNVAQSASYGPEARGGLTESEVIISDEEIDYPRIVEADLLLAMSQKACDKYFPFLKKGGLLLVDSVNVERVPTADAWQVPITKIAEEATGKSVAANMVALGLIVGLTGVVSIEAIEAAVTARAPRGSEEMNVKALRAGLAFVRERQKTSDRE
nr:2-oxoacid:acceptor oxidoreductase family protein [Chloroflexota bacterium]